MHIIKECLISYQVAFAVPLTSVYKPRFDSVVRRLTEAGMVNKWFRDEMEKAAKLAKTSKAKTIATALTLHQFQVVSLLDAIWIHLMACDM